MEIYVENINQLRDVLSKDYNEPVQIILKSGLYEIEEPVIISNKNVTLVMAKKIELYG